MKTEDKKLNYQNWKSNDALMISSTIHDYWKSIRYYKDLDNYDVRFKSCVHTDQCKCKPLELIDGYLTAALENIDLFLWGRPSSC